MSRGPIPAERKAPTDRGPEATAPDRSPGETVVQAKLLVGSVDDPAEREADAVARRVVTRLSAPDREVHRAATTVPGGRVLRSTATVGAEGGVLDRSTEQAIESARGGGAPLDERIRPALEDAFGADFSAVRIHTGARSDELNDRIQARAFTSGSDIFVRRSDYDPGSAQGRQLLAHELTHTIQQGASRSLADGSAGAQRTIRRTALVQRDNSALLDLKQRGLKSAAPTGSTNTAADTAKEEHEEYNDLAEETMEGMDAPGAIGDVDDFKDDMEKARTGDSEAESDDKSGISEEEGQRLGVASGAGDVVSMFIGISQAIAGWRKKGASGMDKADAVLTGATAVTTGAKGVGDMTKSGSELAGHEDGIGESDAASSGLGGIADSFAGIKSTFSAIKNIVDLITETDKMTNEQKIAKSMETVKSLMEAAKSGVSAAKSFMDMVNSSVSASMVASIPGLGIAISCVDIIIRAVDLINAELHAVEMQKTKREFKVSIGGRVGASAKGKAEAILADPAATEEQKAQAEEYLTAKSLEYINDKRVRRQILKIGVAMGNIAGDAATLGGASAPVGIGIKIATAVVNVGAGVFRRFKQWARNQTDKMAPGKAKSVFSWIFNTDKTTEKKQAEYNRIIDHIFDMIDKANVVVAESTSTRKSVGPRREKALATIARIEKYVGAIGMSLSTMSAVARNDGAQGVRDNLFEMLQKRE